MSDESRPWYKLTGIGLINRMTGSNIPNPGQGVADVASNVTEELIPFEGWVNRIKRHTGPKSPTR